MTYNPDFSCVNGPQWFPRAVRDVAVTDLFRTAGALVRSSATETIRHAWVFTPGGAMPAGEGRSFEVEVYDRANLSPSELLVTTHLPSSTPYEVAARGWNGASHVTTGFHNLLDDDPLAPGSYTLPSGVVYNTVNAQWVGREDGQQSRLSLGFAGLTAALPSGAYVKDVVLTGFLDTVNGNTAARAATSFRPFLRIDGATYTQGSRGISDPSVQGVRWSFNPATGRSWRLSDVRKFDTSVGGNSAGWIIGATNSTESFGIVYQVSLQVTYAAVDPRVALGHVHNPGSAVKFGWNRFLFQKPDGSSDWAKQSGTDYVLAVRKRSGSQPLPLRILDSDARDGREFFDPTQVPPQAVANIVVGWDALDLAASELEELNSSMSLTMHTAGGNISPDSQPYAELTRNPFFELGAGEKFSNVNAGSSIEQDFTTLDVDRSYRMLRMLVRSDSTRQPSQPMLVEVRRRGDDAVIVPAQPVSPQLLTRPYDRWQPIVITFDTVSTPGFVASDQHYVRLTCNAFLLRAWQVQGMSTLSTLTTGAPPDVDDTTFDGTNSVGTFETVPRPWLDYCVTMHTQPNAPQDVNVVPVDDGCVGYATITWDAPIPDPSCGDVSGYEVQRQDDDDWVTIAYVIGGTSFDDYEARRNVVTAWRVRALRSDGVFSDWAYGPGDVSINTDCCGLVFVWNGRPDLGVWYTDERPRRWRFIDNRTFLEMEGRDYADEFVEDADRGDEFEVRLVVSADGAIAPTSAPNPRGRRAFDPLLVLSGSQRPRPDGNKVEAPYVAVLDEQGDRWYASVLPLEAQRDEPSGLHVQTVRVRQTRRYPLPIVMEHGS